MTDPIALATSGQLPIDCPPQSYTGLIILGVLGALFWAIVFYTYWNRNE